ncbi:MAG: CehA/McbA family metallohydrolase [Chloroflexota bacterium]
MINDKIVVPYVIMKISLDSILKNEADWYCGDFHAHTNCSPDGYHPPDELVAIAREAGMDFVSFTDHNNLDAIEKVGEQDDVLIIPGCEITLQDGHYNIFGVKGWEEWMEGICDMGGDWKLKLNGRSLTDLVKITAEHGYPNSINHPLMPPWHWQPKETPLDLITSVEIINDPTWETSPVANPAAIEMWTRWLNAGWRITAVGGTDYHGNDRDNPEKNYFPRLNKPLTYVYAKGLSTNNILKGVKKGWVYVSMGPQVRFTAMNEGQQRSIGDDLWIVKDERICFTMQVDGGAPGQTARLVRNGEVITESTIHEARSLFTHEDRREPGQQSWYRLDVVDENGGYQVVTNPIFVEWGKRPKAATFGEFV